MVRQTNSWTERSQKCNKQIKRMDLKKCCIIKFRGNYMKKDLRSYANYTKTRSIVYFLIQTVSKTRKKNYLF